MMRLNTSPGEKVVLSRPDSGWPADQQKIAEAGLKLNETYTVKGIDVGDWHARVELVGVQGMFNVVHFDNAGAE